MSKKNTPKNTDNTIAVNRKARHLYTIEDTFEAGLSLQGWEVKSLRAGRTSIAEAHVQIHRGEAFLEGCQIQALETASTHIVPNPRRKRKLLLHRAEIDKLAGAVDQKGYTIAPLKMYWSKGNAKLNIGLARGKQQQDKRADQKDRDWKREQQRIFKQSR